MDGQCPDMGCSLRYNCCQQADICPTNKICKLVNYAEKPWKRFTCECPDGYHGDNCERPIRSCKSYDDGSHKSGKYKVAGDDNSVFEVYGHFDSNASWTLVQSSSKDDGKFSAQSLFNNYPLNEDSPTWSAYRLSKTRMKSIEDNSAFLQFTCDYEKFHDIKNSDYVQIPFVEIKKHNRIVDVLQFNYYIMDITVQKGRGKLGNDDLSHCHISLFQDEGWPLLMFFPRESQSDDCNINNIRDLSCSKQYDEYYFFSSYYHILCTEKLHRCVQSPYSTTQLWFGTPRGSDNGK